MNKFMHVDNMSYQRVHWSFEICAFKVIFISERNVVLKSMFWFVNKNIASPLFWWKSFKVKMFFLFLFYMIALNSFGQAQGMILDTLYIIRMILILLIRSSQNYQKCTIAKGFWRSLFYYFLCCWKRVTTSVLSLV